MGDSALKFDQEKERFDLLPSYPLWEVVRVYTFGISKYGENNWRKGMKWGRLFAASLRHLFKWWMGERVDEESGLHHLAHVVWQCFALMEYERVNIGEDDRPDTNLISWMRENSKIAKNVKL